jgi:hypothetical protein
MITAIPSSRAPVTPAALSWLPSSRIARTVAVSGSSRESSAPVLAFVVRSPRKYNVYATAVGPVPSAMISPMTSGCSATPTPLVNPADTISIPPPPRNPKPMVLRSSSPATGLSPSSVSAANPLAASTARPALASTVLSR